jgi:hypothetical protein
MTERQFTAGVSAALDDDEIGNALIEYVSRRTEGDAIGVDYTVVIQSDGSMFNPVLTAIVDSKVHARGDEVTR